MQLSPIVPTQRKKNSCMPTSHSHTPFSHQHTDTQSMQKDKDCFLIPGYCKGR